MSRKPFEALTGESFEDAYGITQHDWNGRPDIPWMEVQARSRDVANAAIAQDREYALRRIREENHEGMIYYRERDEARAERDHFQNENTALREENGRLKAGYTELSCRWDKVNTQLAEAVKVLDGLVKHCAEAHYEDCSIMYDLDEEKCDCGSGAAHDKARDFLAKAKT